jgi:peptide/nickel transport system permease protein
MVERVKHYARMYFRSKIGVIGLAIILFFALLATLAPFITSNNPVTDFNVASPYAVPSWATFIPKYQNLPPTTDLVTSPNFGSSTDLSHWEFQGSSTGENLTVLEASGVFPSGQLQNAGSLFVNASFTPQGSTSNTFIPGQEVFTMTQTVNYPYKPPNEFSVSAMVRPVLMSNVSNIYVNFEIASPTHTFSLGTVSSYTLRNAITIPPNRLGSWVSVSIPSGLLPSSGNPDFNYGDPGSTIFSKPGSYHFSVQIFASPSGNISRVSVYITDISFHILGRSYGLLGTDTYGRDVWSQFVWGSQISFLVGILAALGSVGVGTIVGLAAGLWGGKVDEGLMRTADVFLVLPFLPLAIVVVLIVGQNPVLYKGIYYWIIILFTVLSWPFVARIIRSQVLSVKERQFVEASRALGGGQWHIMSKHILPNVMGLVYSQTALLVPGFILTEAGLDFLAISVHPISTITWGIMLTQAQSDALTNVVADYAWWWFLPPGLAIAVLSLAFVLVGFALDSIFNPKLRAR